MKGSIVKRNGKYSIVVYLGKDSFGKKKQRWFSGYTSKKEAERELPKILIKVQNGELIDNNNSSLGAYLADWLETKIKKDNLSPTTADGYRNIIYNHIIPAIGSLKLQDVKPYNLQKYVDLKSETLSPKTLNNHKRVLSNAFIYAVDMELIERNPLVKVRFPREKKVEVKPYDIEQSMKLIEIVQENRFLSIPVTLALFLGLRRGECLGLRWEDIDFKDNKIYIRQNLEYVKGEYYFKEPKTHNSVRTLTAPQILMDLLKEHKIWQNEMQLGSGGAWANEYKLVCVRPKDGKPITTHVLSDYFRLFLKKNKLPHIKFHDLRHTNATLMLATGTNSRVAMKRLGHSNISITLGLYSHVLENMDTEAADNLDRLFGVNLENGLADGLAKK